MDQSPPLQAILIDDEENNRINLTELLKVYCPNVVIFGQCKNAMEGFEMIRSNPPDLVFLDVEMPGGTGFDLLEKLRPIEFSVVFVTAYDKYAIRAFRFSAVDYLLKPINILDLQAAVKKVADQKSKSHRREEVDQLIEHHFNPTKVKKIALPTSDQLLFTPVDQIIRCAGESNYTHFYLEDGSHILVTRTLKEYDELLTPYGFIRTHQSHLVNLQKVKKYVRRDGGYLIMQDNENVPISRSKKEEVLLELSRL